MVAPRQTLLKTEHRQDPPHDSSIAYPAHRLAARPAPHTGPREASEPRYLLLNVLLPEAAGRVEHGDEPLVDVACRVHLPRAGLVQQVAPALQVVRVLARDALRPLQLLVCARLGRRRLQQCTSSPG